MHAEPIFFTRPDRNTWFFNAAVAKAGMNKESETNTCNLYKAFQIPE